MKILAGIPTYHRQTAPRLAEQFSKHFDEVVIVPQDTSLPESPRYRVVPVEKGIARARSEILHQAAERNCDLALLCDDDMKMTDEFISEFIRLATSAFSFNKIGAVSARTRLMAFWNKETGANKKNFWFHPLMAGMYFVRTETAKEVGDFDFPILEDLDYTLRIIEKKYITIQLTKPGLFFNHAGSRHNKTDTSGGFSTEEMHSFTPEAVQEINRRHGHLAEATILNSGRHRVKFKWAEIQKLLPDIGMKYEDKRGISF